MSSHHLSRLVAFFILLALSLAFVSGITAQESDAELLAEAAAQTGAASAYEFDFTLDSTLSGIPNFGDSTLAFQGNGAFSRSEATPAVDLTLRGEIEFGAVRDRLDIELRLVDGVLYYRFPGSPRWSGIPMSELLPLARDVAVTSFIQGFSGNMAALSGEQIATGSLDDPGVQTAVNTLVNSVSSLDVAEFASVERLPDETLDGESTAHFNTSVSVGDLAASEQAMNLLVSVVQIADPTTTSALTGADRAGIRSLMGRVFEDSTLTIDQYVSLNDKYLRRTTVNLDLTIDPAQLQQNGEVVSFSVNFDLNLRNFDNAPAIAAPQDALVVSGLANMLDLTDVSALPQPAQEDAAAVSVQQATPAPTTTVKGQPLVPNSPTVVRLTAAAPLDLTYAGNAGEVVSIVVRSLEEPGTVDTVLTVLDARGTQLAENDDHATTRTNLESFDSVIESLQLPEAGNYTIRIDSFSGEAEGNVEVTVESASRPVAPQAGTPPPDNQAGVAQDATVTGQVPTNSSYTYPFTAAAGQVVTITVRATSSALDPQAQLIGPNGDVLAENDDHEDTDPNLTGFDSRIRNFTIPQNGDYTVRIAGFAGTGGPFELTLNVSGEGTPNAQPTPVSAGLGDEVFNGEIRSGGSASYPLQGNAGDVVTIAARSTGGDLDPQIFIFDSAGNFITSNDDHGTSEASLNVTDARVENLILPASGEYTIDVYGYDTTAGSFELTISRVATGAPTGPGTEEITTGSIQANGSFTYTFTAQQGDYVTIAVRALTSGFDPQATLSDSSGRILADNDDHGTSELSLGRLDSRIENYQIPASGSYTIEITGYRDSAGSFAITITTLR